jgi:hypothetical protein
MSAFLCTTASFVESLSQENTLCSVLICKEFRGCHSHPPSKENWINKISDFLGPVRKKANTHPKSREREAHTKREHEGRVWGSSVRVPA